MHPKDTGMPPDACRRPGIEGWRNRGRGEEFDGMNSSSRTGSSIAWSLAAALLLGTALLGAGAVVHPVLAGDAAAHLRTIAETEYWRAAHLAMLAGTGLVIAGLWVRVLIGAADDGASTVPSLRPPLLAALAVISVGLAINALNIAYMAGAGLHMAAAFEGGDPLMASLYDATHPIGLMAARFGNFLVALGALVLGWVEWQEPAGRRLPGVLAWVAAAGGIIGVMFFHEGSRAVLAAVALLCGWQVVTGFRVVAGTRSGA